NPQLFVQPMSRWHLFPTWKNGVETGTRMQFVWLFSIIGLFVLILACINFMNLSTAQSEKRAREVGIRKSVGSARLQLVYQFLAESFMVVFFSFVFAIAIVSISLPLFNEIADKRLTMPWSNLYFWAIGLGFIVITALLAGIYPAGYLSSFQPVKVLKGTFKAGRNAAIPRKVLVVVQFTVSIILIIGTMVVWQQVQYAKNRPIGYSREGLIMIRKNAADLWGRDEALKNELIKAGAIVDMAGSSNPPTSIWFTDSQFSWRGKDPNVQTEFATMGVTHDYGKTMGWEFVLGRDYSREFLTDSSAVILNETAAKLMAFDDPLNEEITWQGKKLKVIGVIKDMIMGSPYEPVKQTIFYFDARSTIWFNMRLNPGLGTAESIARIEKVFNDLFPAVPFEFKFTDQEYALKFFGEERIGKLASLFATLAILISCLGLFGMSSFVAEQRRKEIGIRKVLGATVTNLWKMLSWEFVSLVGISCIIGIPIAWIYLNQWLQRYEYHTEVSVWVLAAASGGSILITLLTVSFQTIKASVS
ncbi:MAG: ABC transporter permease, partial [Marivirga sp.]|nr:ABC transporter permease [Marivirga sp.]